MPRSTSVAWSSDSIPCLAEPEPERAAAALLSASAFIADSSSRLRPTLARVSSSSRSSSVTTTEKPAPDSPARTASSEALRETTCSAATTSCR